jgi:N-acylglucosamine-6-phosphate 2-epimerase
MSMPAYSIALTAIADESNRDVLERELTAFNKQRSPDFAALYDESGKQQPLDVYVRDENGQILGGLSGCTYWGWLTIGLMWLDERLRGQSYGTQIVALAEEEAQRRGCTHSRVTTYSFQARGFYEKLGYRVVGQLDDFPPGGAYYTLRKDFAS